MTKYSVIWEDNGIKSRYNCSWDYARGIYDSYKKRATKSVMIIRQSDHDVRCYKASKGRYNSMIGYYYKEIKPRLC